MDKKISDDDVASELSGDELIPVVQEGENRRSSPKQILEETPLEFDPENYSLPPSAKGVVEDHLKALDDAFEEINGGTF